MAKCYFSAYDDMNVLLLTRHLQQIFNPQREIQKSVNYVPFLLEKILTQNAHFILNGHTNTSVVAFCGKWLD